jgi:hypothetical protein
VGVGGPNWQFTANEVRSLIERKKVEFYVQVGDEQRLVRTIPYRMFGLYWDLTTETVAYPHNNLDTLPVHHQI